MSSTELDAQDIEVRRLVYDTVMGTGKVPLADNIASVLATPTASVRESLRLLEAAHMLLLQRGSGEILMANPFSAVPTPFQIESGGVSYWGNCIWDSLGVAAILHRDARIIAACGDCGEAMQLNVEGGNLTHAEGIIHFAIPARRWWDNLVYT